MIKKRVLVYFIIMAFPMGLGAGAASWFRLPRLPLRHLAAMWKVVDDENQQQPFPTAGGDEPQWAVHVPDFSAIHPLVVGSFSLLLCAGILLAADKPKTGADRVAR